MARQRLRVPAQHRAGCAQLLFSDRAAYRQNQYGGTLGGLLFRTGVEWFADYQGTRLTEGIDTGDIAVPSLAERGGDFSQVPLTGSVNGNAWAAHLSSALGQTVTPGEPYAQVFPTGRFRNPSGRLRPKSLLASIPEPNSGTAVFETATAAETLGDNKAALRADWSHGEARPYGLLLFGPILAG